MKRFFCLCLLWALAAVAVAQQGYVDASPYGKQYHELYKRYLADTLDVKAMLDLSSFYSDEKNPMHSFALAVKYANKAERTYYTMIERGDNHRAVSRLIKLGITIEVAQARRQAAILQAGRYIVASRSITEEELDAMLRDCGDSPAMRRLIEKKRIIMHCDKAQKENTMEGYKAFIERYPATAEAYDCQVVMGKLAVSLVARAATAAEVDSLLAPYSTIPTVQHAARERKSDLAFDSVRRYGNADQLHAFLRRYPYTGRYLSALDEIDRVQEQHLQHIEDPDSLLLFIRQNETSPLCDVALKKLRNRIIEHNDARAAKIYFDHFPHDMEWAALFLVYYRRYAAEGCRNVLDNFSLRYPQFPYPKRLQMDVRHSVQVDSMDFLRPFAEADYAQYLTYVYNAAGSDMAYIAMLRTLQPAIARKNWNAVVQRIAEFQPGFMLHGSDLADRLFDLIDSPTDPRKVVAAESTPGYDMLHPCMTADGEYLYYTRRENGRAHVHVASRAKGKNYKWVSLGDVKVVGSNEGDYLFYGLYDSDRRMLLGYNKDIWTAVRVSPTVWTLEQCLPAPVNTEYNDFDPFMLADGSGLLLASDRPYGQNMQNSGAYYHGDTAVASDLYYVPRTPQGWGPAVNLGSAVNSLFCERAPLLSGDLKTLYFITDGHAGMGFGDIYCATRTDVDDWSSWQEAVNYGKEVNSGKEEASLAFSPNGTQLLFSSNRGNHYGCYTVAAVMGAATAPAPALISSSVPCRLKVVEPHSHLLLAATDTVGDTLQPLLYRTKRYLAMPQQVVDVKGFVPSVPVSGGDTLQLCCYVPCTSADTIEATPVSDTVVATPAPLPQRAWEVPLPAVTFEGGGFTLSPEGQEELRRVAHYLCHHPHVQAALALYVADNDDAACFEIGRRRSAIVQRYMEQNGIAGTRTTVANYGRLDPQKGTTELYITLFEEKE